VYKSRSYRKNPKGYTKEMVKELGDDWSTVGESKVRNGDYVVTPMFKGVYHVKKFLYFCDKRLKNLREGQLKSIWIQMMMMAICIMSGRIRS